MKGKVSDCSRREFLSRTSVGLASVSLAGFTNVGKYRGTSIQSETGIIHRTLGKTGIRLPIVSMGVMNANNPELIPRSYELGVRLFDTAMRYQGGRNEEMVGTGIEKMGVRDKVTVATKIPAADRGRDGSSTLDKNAVKKQFLEDFDGCSKRLRTDYVDILMLHNIRTGEEARNPGVVEALTQLKKEGRARFIGVSTHSGQDLVLNEVAGMDFYDVVLFSVNFTMADNKALFDAIENAAKKGIGLIAMKTQGGGRQRKNLGPINETAALKFVLRNEHIATAIPGYTNFEHMEQDFSVARGLDLNEEEKAFLESKEIQVATAFCQQCYECVETCPNSVDIPTLMRTHMYASQYSNFYEARATLESLADSKSLGVCTSCSTCAAQCAHMVDIPHSIGELKAMYA
jgi:predicted aldo/keto reductase-like oxidoreductase